GPQRFGHGGKNLAEALRWLTEQLGSDAATQIQADESQAGSSPELLPHERRRSSRSRKKGRGNDARFENKMMPSVIQSEIFNRYITLRLARSEPLLLGEVVRLDGAGKSFVVENLEAEL